MVLGDWNFIIIPALKIFVFWKNQLPKKIYISDRPSPATYITGSRSKLHSHTESLTTFGYMQINLKFAMAEILKKSHSLRYRGLLENYYCKFLKIYRKKGGRYGGIQIPKKGGRYG